MAKQKKIPAPLDILPHRPPMLYLDRVTKVIPDKRIEGFWEPGKEQFEGHFGVGRLVLPGVKTVEHLAQAASFGVLLERPGMYPLFSGIEGTRFIKPVFPGDMITSDVDILSVDDRGKVLAQGVAYAGEGMVCSTRLSFKLVTEDRFLNIVNPASSE